MERSDNSGDSARPHFTDNIIAWLESGRISPWLFYALYFVLVGVLFTLASWILAVKPFGTFVPAYFILGTWFVELLLANHLIVRLARRALDDFRPLMPHQDAQYQEIKNLLTMVPSLPGNIAVILGAVTGLAITAYAWRTMTLVQDLPLLFIQVTGAVGFALTGVAAYRGVHQLRVVQRLLNDITEFNFYDLSAVYGLSLFPINVIVLYILFLWVNPALLIFPDMFASSSFLGLWVLVSLFPALLILPLLGGIRNRLVDEKQARLRENGEHLAEASAQLYEAIKAGDRQTLFGLEPGINSLLAFRRELESVSTWPWRPETIRWLATALFLPLGLWVVQFVIQRFVVR